MHELHIRALEECFLTVGKSVGVGAGIIIVLLTMQNAVAQLPPQMIHKVIVADEGNGKVHCINLANPSERWSITTANRDLQLIGSDRLMVSVGDGYAEYNVKTGAFIKKVSVGGTVQSVFRLSDTATFIGIDGNPASIREVDSTGKEIRKINFAVNASIRIIRPTSDGTFLVGGKVAGTMYECDSTGVIQWEVQAGGEPYMALRLPNGNTLISTGFGCQMVLVDAEAKVLKRFPTDADKNGSEFWSRAAPNFFAGFQVLENGNIVVSNWEGHGGGNGSKGFQLIEIDSSLTKVVSYWEQDPALISSLHGVLVLDGLDTELMYSDMNGALAPVPSPVAVVHGVSLLRHSGHGSLLSAVGGARAGGMVGLDGRSAAPLIRRNASGVYIGWRGTAAERTDGGISNENRNAVPVVIW